MKTNQAFAILQAAGGIRAARIITENKPKLGRVTVWRMARALRRGVPVAKIIGQKWFYGLKFYTNRYTLDPRPDTEALVGAVIADCGNGVQPTILDLGTGTGCVICALVKNIHGARGVAIEKSWRALRVARKNIRDLGLGDKIIVQHGDFARNNLVTQQFDVIVSNPPYIPQGDARVDIGARHDPHMALYATDNGLGAYKIIAKNAKNWLKKCGNLYLEIGDGQADDIKNIFLSQNWCFLRSEFDLGGVERVLVFKLKTG